MHHVLRCWERQSNGSEHKKTLRRPGLRPGPHCVNLQRSRKSPIWWGGAGCPLPKNPIPRSRPFGPRLSYPHSKISSDAVHNNTVAPTTTAAAAAAAALFSFVYPKSLQVRSGFPASLLKKNLWGCLCEIFLQVGYPSCHSTNSVKALNERTGNNIT